MSKPQQWTGSEELAFLCRHLIALCVTYETIDASNESDKTRFIAYAGTLIHTWDAYCFLTAGHCLREIKHALSNSQVYIKNAVLADTFGLEAVSDQPIPFDLVNAPMFFVDDSIDGLDYGIIFLAPYYVRLLAKNKITALEERNWIHQDNIEFDGFAMLGLPAEFTSEFVSETGTGQVSPTMFRVHRQDAPPEDSPPTSYPRFVGRVDSELPLKSVKGMSGGPIFGFQFGPPMRYWIVALQSSWLPSKRVVFGCPLPILAAHLKSLMDAANAQ